MSGEGSFTIAIDGPAASGKSTVARRVALALGCVFVNSGAMYRAFTWWILEQGIDPRDRIEVLDLLQRTRFSFGEENLVGTIEIEGRRLDTPELKSSGVNRWVSAIAAIPEVRSRLVAEQRAYGDRTSLVMEGRDIGTVVFPDTPYKFFIDADPETRARRRRKEGISDSIRDRDRQDSSREDSPLVAAEDAVLIDTTHLEVDEVVNRVLGDIERRRGSGELA